MTSFVHAKSRVPGEWILTLDSTDRSFSWDKVNAQMENHYKLIRIFGPAKRHALFQFNGKRAILPFQLPKGIRVQPNFFYSVLEADPDLPKQWALKNTGQVAGDSGNGLPGIDLNTSRAWEIFSGSRGVVIAVLDTGIETDHPDLQSNRWKNKKEIPGNSIDEDGNGFVDDTEGWNFVDGNKNIEDLNHHGTQVIGIIGADTENGKGGRGVLKETSVMTVKILDEAGTGTTERAISGIEYAVRNGAKIINASWGGRSYDQALYDAVKWAGESGVVFVAAAGNSSNDNDNDPQPVYPASFKLPNVISVASHDNKGEKASTSSYGKTTTHLEAPGVQIYTTNLEKGYTFTSGTSFAAPFVTSATALVLGYMPSLTMAEVKTRLIETTVPVSYYDRNLTQSGGRLDLYNLLKGIRPERPKEPSSWKRVNWSQTTPHPYDNFDKLNWSVSQPGATHIRIHFKRFETETGYDILRLKDKQGRGIASYSGSLDSFTSSDGLGDTLALEFEADYVKSAYGFDIDYYEYSTE